MIKKNILLLKAYGLTSHNMTVTQPLGLMYIASFLRAKSPDKYNIKILDTRLYSMEDYEVEKVLQDFKPDVVGISAVTMEAKSMHNLSSIVKKVAPDCKIAIGGPHATSFTEKALNDDNVDCAILGEGEVTFKAYINGLENGSDIKDVRGLAYMKDGKLYKTADRDYIENLDSIPFPAWDLIDFDVYKNFMSETPMGKRNDMVLFTSRSCPYNCIYCHKIFGKGFRARSPENVLKEIDILYNKYGIREFDIIDDCFNLKTSRAEKICDMIIEKGYKIVISFPNGLRTDRLKKETLKKMYDAGTRFISFAIESASPRIQKLIKKDLKIDKVREVINYAVELGILSNGFFMIGFPSETKEEVYQTINYALASRLHLACFLIVTPFEGTELYNKYCKDIKDVPVDFTDYSYHRSYFNLSEVPGDTLTDIQKNVYRRFYFNPVRAIRIVSTYIKIGYLSCLFLLFKMALGKIFLKLPGKKKDCSSNLQEVL